MREDALGRARRVASDLRRALERRGIRVGEVYLFGSHARGDYLKSSDIDLLVVSEDWEGIPFLKRLDIVNEVIWRENLGNVEALPVTKRELETRGSVILRDAAKYWIKL